MTKRIKLQKKTSVNPYDTGYMRGYDAAYTEGTVRCKEATADLQVRIIELKDKVDYETKRWHSYSAKYQRLHTQYLALTTPEQRDKACSIGTTVQPTSMPAMRDPFEDTVPAEEHARILAKLGNAQQRIRHLERKRK